MKKTILVIDDEKNPRQILDKKLSSEGFNVLTAKDGNSGLDIVSKEKVDLILLDILMPGLDGIGFIKKINTTPAKNIPIIVLTNLSQVSPTVAVKQILVKADTDLDDVVAAAKSQLK